MQGNRTRLIALEGLGHEPELETYNTLNHYMDTLTYQVTKFFYEETAPNVVLPASQLTISENASLKSFFYEVTNGFPVQISAEGGVKTNSNPLDASVIWFKNRDNRKLIFLTTNKFEAWNEKSFPVKIVK
jgi:hypothetical protein